LARVTITMGTTDTVGGSVRTMGIGAYAPMQGYTSNWRYFDDVYVFVVDASGIPSATGFAIIAGSTAEAPNPPSSVDVR
jgi:hypothetical protein